MGEGLLVEGSLVKGYVVEGSGGEGSSVVREGDGLVEYND